MLAELFVPTTASLRDDLKAAREMFYAGEITQAQYRKAFEDLWSSAASDGYPLDSLTVDGSIDARIAAHTASGVEHDYWLGPLTVYGTPNISVGEKTLVVRRYLYMREHGVEPDRYRESVKTTCDEKRCVRLEHLVIVRKDRRLFSDQQMLGAVQVAAMQLGHTPSMGEWERGGYRPSFEAIRQRFGTWGKAVSAAGLQPRERGDNLNSIGRYKRVWLEENTRAAILADAEKRGRLATSYEWQQERKQPSMSTIRRRFGGWNAITKGLV